MTYIHITYLESFLGLKCTKCFFYQTQVKISLKEKLTFNSVIVLLTMAYKIHVKYCVSIVKMYLHFELCVTGRSTIHNELL